MFTVMETLEDLFDRRTGAPTDAFSVLVYRCVEPSMHVSPIHNTFRPHTCILVYRCVEPSMTVSPVHNISRPHPCVLVYRCAERSMHVSPIRAVVLPFALYISPTPVCAPASASPSGLYLSHPPSPLASAAASTSSASCAPRANSSTAAAPKTSSRTSVTTRHRTPTPGMCNLTLTLTLTLPITPHPRPKHAVPPTHGSAASQLDDDVARLEVRLPAERLLVPLPLASLSLHSSLPLPPWPLPHYPCPLLRCASPQSACSHPCAPPLPATQARYAATHI